MEKNINMQNADDLCLRYVLNELDPSEVLMVEKAMREDEDVLIEIECLRATLRKVNKLPQQSPPDLVRQKILNYAAERCERKKIQERNKTLQTACYAIAAVLVLAVGVGLYGFSESGEITSDSSLTVSSLSTPAPQLGASAASAAGSVILSATPGFQSGDVQPWVDRNNVLRIDIRSGAQGLSIITPTVSGDAPSSGLVPVERHTGNFNSGMRDLQLTRTQY